MSTDPAHSLGDALEADLGGEPVEVDGAVGLFAAHVDARGLARGRVGRLREHLRTLLAGAGVDELLADELTVLPGVEELLALGEVRRAAPPVPGTSSSSTAAPTAETLRLLALPEAIGGYLERLFPAHRRAVRGLLAGGVAGEAARRGALGPRRGRPRPARRRPRRPARDARRARHGHPARAHPRADGRRRDPPHADGAGAARAAGRRARREPARPRARHRIPARAAAAHWLRERAAEQAAVLADLDAAGAPVRTVGYRAAEPTGVAALLELAAEMWGGDDPAADPAADRRPPPLLRVRRTAGDGRALDSAFELALRLPGAAAGALDLAGSATTSSPSPPRACAA